MNKEISRNVRLGAFVISGAILLIVGLYSIGKSKNMFGKTFSLSCEFTDVNGLSIGNNVRYSGIDVGIVDEIEFTNDSIIKVEMLIDEKFIKYIRSNSVAAIGTDGLMGNKLVNIIPASGPAEGVEDGDILSSIEALETAEIFRKLDTTNDDISIIARNLRILTERVNSQNTLWSILMDTTVAENIKQAIVNIKITGDRTATITGDLSRIIKEVKSGKGAVGALLTDTSFENKLHQTIVNIKLVSDTFAYISGDLRSVSQKIKNGEGAVGTILMDTAFVHNLNKSMENIEKGTEGFNENMQALKQNIFLRKYFKKQEKKKNK